MKLIYEAIPHHLCVEEVEIFRAGRIWHPGTIVKCDCDRYYMIDENGNWEKVIQTPTSRYLDQ